MEYPELKLRRWQRECLDSWVRAGCRGVAHAATGAGKTLLALAAVRELILRPEFGGPDGPLVRIVVPKVFLAAQWQEALTGVLGVRPEDIALRHGGTAARRISRYMIYVVNSARWSLARQIRRELASGERVLLICDECHHCVSEANARIFDFLPELPQLPGRYFALGLTATPGSDAERATLTASLGPDICRYGPAEALRDGIMTGCRLINVAVTLTAAEQDEYGAVNEQLLRCTAKLKKLDAALQMLSGAAFFDAVRRISGGASGRAAECAKLFLRLVYRRRMLIHTASMREECAVDLCARLPEDSRILVFAQRVSTVEAVYRRLERLFPGQAVRYTGSMEKTVKRRALEAYQNGSRRILISCQALDEGLNIAETDVGVLMACSGSERQRIQRAGRVLRPVPLGSAHFGRTKTLYYLYVPATPEDAELLPLSVPGLKRLSAEYRGGEWIRPGYDCLCAALLEQTAQKDAPPEICDELIRNLRLLGARCDDMLPPDEAEGRMRESRGTRERNYWLTVLRLIRAREPEKEN